MFLKCLKEWISSHLQTLALSFVLGMPLWAHSHCLVYVHLGSPIPNYLVISVAQARLFNPTCPIYVIADPEACQTDIELEAWGVKKIPSNSLKRSWQHEIFTHRVPNRGLFLFAKERFYYLEELVRQYQLEDVFHMENDVMLYFNLEEKVDLFRQIYSGMIAVPFDDDTRSVPSFLYIHNPEPLGQLVDFLCSKADEPTADMELISQFKDLNYKIQCDHLPIIMPSYVDHYPLVNIYGRAPAYSVPFFNRAEDFQLVFDAAAIGQFLDGLDTQYHLSNLQGFINQLCVFNMGLCQFEWRKDAQERYVPYLTSGGRTLQVANLHVHSKRLHLFYSKNDVMPEVPSPIN